MNQQYKPDRTQKIYDSFCLYQRVGKTPLIYFPKLSAETGNHLFGKAEFLSPGGSVKDRTSLGIIRYLESQGKLKKGMTIYEGTAGNTGIGLAILSKNLGYQVHIIMPDNQSQEKYRFLRALGVSLTLTKPVPFKDSNHFYHTARRMAEEDPNGVWADQFENPGNYMIHENTTGPEIWEDLQGQIHFFGCSAGTGGTIGGVTRYLKSRNPQIQCYLFDPMGSGLYSYVKSGVIASSGQSVTEGIGIMRITHNFAQAHIDDAYQIPDVEMFEILDRMAKEEGLFLGLSAALNVSGLYRWAKANSGKGLVGVTILCDLGTRYMEKIRC